VVAQHDQVTTCFPGRRRQNLVHRIALHHQALGKSSSKRLLGANEVDSFSLGNPPF